MLDLVVHRQRCLALLQARKAQGARTAEISDPAVGGHEGPRRVRELRAMGYPIRAQPLHNGYWRYWLAQPGERFPTQATLFDDQDGDR